MAKAAAQQKIEQGKELAKVDDSKDLALLMEEMGDEQGLGVSMEKDDGVVPFMKLLQDMNPEVKKRDDKYVDGAEPGCLLNTATRELWTPDEESKYLYNVDGQQLFLQPCLFQRAIVEWVPRDMGGGMVANTPYDAANIDEMMTKLGGVQKPDPRDSAGRKMLWMKGQNELKDTRYHFCNVVRDDDQLESVILSFSSTGHRTSQAWTMLMRKARLPNRTVAHSWMKKYPVRSVTRSGNGNEWFVLEIDDGPFMFSRQIISAGRDLYDSVIGGKLRAAAEESSDGSAGSAAAEVI